RLATYGVVDLQADLINNAGLHPNKCLIINHQDAKASLVTDSYFSLYPTYEYNEGNFLSIS
ncbi:hypothetical protein, partial [Vibrio sp. 1S139]|uniref:hypothetical protein n=1 Tax=Vibrio sp. 1S139 TaxID=3230006 RepID=UPI00352F073F